MPSVTVKPPFVALSFQSDLANTGRNKDDLGELLWLKRMTPAQPLVVLFFLLYSAQGLPMKTFSPGDTQSGLCHKDGRVSITFRHRDVPFRDGNGNVKGILVGVCDCCGDAVLIPAQSTPAIAATLSSQT